MSRQPAQRSLTLTEDLERLEQQITLTLQEIDSNFSKAHRIVTSSILPVVEQYAKHSNEVWESSKFWKQFFESAANVSLSGYEEAALEDETTHTEDSLTDAQTPKEHGSNAKAGAQANVDDTDDDFTVDSPTQVAGVQSTPKLTPSTTTKATTVKKPTALRSPSPRKYTGKNSLARSDEPSTPNAQSNSFSSPFEPESAFRPASQTRQTKQTQNFDPLLHRSVLDKNYRVQSTPFKQRDQIQQSKPASRITPAAASKKAPWDDSPDSSPEISAPQLRSEFFSPPPKQTAARQGPRTPGISVQKPARNHEGVPTTSTGRKLFSPDDKAMHTDEARPTYYFSRFDSDEEDDTGNGFAMSPPKTLQFHVPQSRLLQTPARDASKRIVEDLLATAGMEGDTTNDIDDDTLEASPSVVRARYDEDDTF